jgi:uncharacterized membrane protein
MFLTAVGRRRTVWTFTVLLCLIGVGAAVGRTVFTADLSTRMLPARAVILEAFDRRDPDPEGYAALVRYTDSRYAAHPRLALMHVLPGALFLLLAPLQFSRTIRRRNLTLHRWSGRLLLTLGVVLTVPAIYFGILHPFAGRGEAISITLISSFFLYALGRAFAAIRGKDVARHREWMLRGFAAAIGIATVRVVAFPIDLLLSPAGYGPADLFVLAIWVGWLLTLGSAELWIRRTRVTRSVERVTTRVAPTVS